MVQNKSCLILFLYIILFHKISLSSPFNGCTFYKSRLLRESFAGASDHGGCANFSAVNGRHGCKKSKLFIPYNGDDVQMWLPDYFIEVTKHIGRSIFAESLDGVTLKAQLGLATAWWGFATSSTVTPKISNGSQSDSGHDNFWHVRILTVPYGSLANNYPPLAVAKGNGLPFCYSGISEFFPAQWTYNISDAAFAFAWSPVGTKMCLTASGAVTAGAVAAAKASVGKIISGTKKLPSITPVQCANPVGASEGTSKNALPTSDAYAPLLSGDLTQLCMGTWGNLIPRTGWIPNEDPQMSAMMAAYKFMSLAGDFHLNSDLKPKSDDKWQIVYPPRIGGKCFTPGSPLNAITPAADDPLTRSKDELDSSSSLKNYTYIIAVWRKRESCEEPMQFVGGWSADYKANYYKNLGVCQAMWSK